MSNHDVKKSGADSDDGEDEDEDEEELETGNVSH